MTTESKMAAKFCTACFLGNAFQGFDRVGQESKRCMKEEKVRAQDLMAGSAGLQTEVTCQMTGPAQPGCQTQPRKEFLMEADVSQGNDYKLGHKHT